MRWVRTLAIASALVLGGPLLAMAQDREPDWLKKPTPGDLYSVWPKAAWEAGEGGKAVIHCVVATTGALRDCEIKSESPAGSGFGAAALALAPQLLMRPALKNGQAVVSDVSIPLAFVAPGKRTGSRLLGPEGGSTVRVFRNMPWITAPSLAEFVAAVPARARASKTAGFVTEQCRLDKQGRLVNCDTLQEQPEGMGFARAARDLLPKFRAPTQDGSGASTQNGMVPLRFTFSPETWDAATPMIGKPDWTALPSSEALAAVLPDQARKAGVLKARVLMVCTIAADGGLVDCKVASEEPPAFGYGAATLKLAQTFRINLWSTEGLPTVGGSVRVPIRFDFTDNPPPAKP
jgi:TonB family protein